MNAEETQRVQVPLRYARLLHLMTSREKMLLVMASHARTNGAAAHLKGWAVAGLLASQEAWDRFSRAWGDASSKCEPDGNLAALFEACKITGLGSALSLAASERRSAADGDSLLPRTVSDPLLLCFEHCLLEAARRLRALPSQETLCCIMDGSDPLASAALWHFEELKNLAPRPVRERLGALGFESKDDFPPLRAADWLAARCYDRLPEPTPAGQSDSPAEEAWIRLTLLEGGRPAALPEESQEPRRRAGH